MASSIGRLIVELAANTGSFETDMGRAAKIAEKRAKEIDAQFAKLAKNALGAFAAVFSASAITSAIKNSIALGDELAKAAQKSGIAAEQFSALAHAAKMSDVDVNSLSTAIRKMQINLSNAGSGAEKPKEALRALGLELSSIRSLSPDKQFELIGEAINRLKDPADKARAATELFGKAGADLLPLFSEGAEGLRKAKEEAERLGLVFTEEKLKKFQEADDATKRLAAAWQGLANTLTLAVEPVLTRILNGMANILSGGKRDLMAELDNEVKRRGNILESIRRTEAQLAKEESKIGRGGSPVRVRELQALLAKGTAQLAQVEARMNSINSEMQDISRRNAISEDIKPPGFADAEWKKESKELLDFIEERSNEVRDALAGAPIEYVKEIEDLVIRQAEARDAQEKSEEDYLTFVDKFYRDLDDMTKTSAEKQAEALKEFQTTLDLLVTHGLDPKIAEERLKEFKKSFDTLSIYADQAARNIQSDFADFLFDPFEDGLKGMLRGFIDVIRRMVAEWAAAQIFAPKSKGGFGLGDIISGGLSTIFGGGSKSGGGSSGKVLGPLATGTNYVPSDGLALLHKGEAVIPAAYNPSAGGVGSGITINNNVDARGATADAIAALPEVLRRNNEQLEHKIIEGLRRRRYALA